MTRIGSLTTEIVTAYQKGERILEIATRMGIGQASVWRTLKAKNIPRRTHGVRRQTIKVPTDPVVIGYLAGLFDGEGNVQFKMKHSGRSLSCKLGIYNTDPNIHEWLVEKIGGKVHWRTDRCIKFGWKPCGVWEIYRAADVRAFLSCIAPYVIIKRDAIAASLDMYSHLSTAIGY